MKKDIEWLKAQIYTEMMYLEHIRKERWSGVKYQTLRSVYQKINQLDETEVLSQEWIDEHSDGPRHRQYVWVDYLKELLVSKQELPVIPKFMAEFIEVRKSTDAYSLKYILGVSVERNEREYYTKAYDWIADNDEDFARAWLDGYEVEEEQKYYIMDKDNRLLLYQFRYGEDKQPIEVVGNFTIEEVKQQNRTMPEITLSDYQFTEQEIKDYDERFWPFAVKTEEMGQNRF